MLYIITARTAADAVPAEEPSLNTGLHSSLPDYSDGLSILLTGNNGEDAPWPHLKSSSANWSPVVHTPVSLHIHSMHTVLYLAWKALAK